MTTVVLVELPSQKHLTFVFGRIRDESYLFQAGAEFPCLQMLDNCSPTAYGFDMVSQLIRELGMVLDQDISDAARVHVSEILDLVRQCDRKSALIFSPFVYDPSVHMSV